MDNDMYIYVVLMDNSVQSVKDQKPKVFKATNNFHANINQQQQQGEQQSKISILILYV